MLGHLAGIGQAGEAEPLTDAYIRDELLTLLFAGHETTANALTWACYALAGESDLQERLAAEIHQALGARLPTADDHPRLPYAEWVVLETLRLYPPSWISGRELTERCEIGPYTVPKGAVTLMSQWILHRDPRYYADPERFQPERWQDGLARCLPRGAYFPFGSGPHRCLGNHFALLEALLCLTTLVQAFRFERVPGQQVSWQPAVTLRPDQPVLLRLQRRHKR